MDKSIRVRILGRDYPLRVQEQDEAAMRATAARLDARIQAFKQAHPEQPDLVAAVVTALALAEELAALRQTQHTNLRALDAELDALDRHLAEAMPSAES